MILKDKLIGSRICIRQMETSDISSQFIGWLHDSAINEFLEVRKSPPNYDEQVQYLELCKKSLNKLYLAIVLNDRRLIGSTTWTSDGNRIEIGLMIGDKEFHGVGLGREVIELAIDWATSAGYKALTAGYLAGNTPSAKLFARAGFEILNADSENDTMGAQAGVIRTELLLKRRG